MSTKKELRNKDLYQAKNLNHIAVSIFSVFYYLYDTYFKFIMKPVIQALIIIILFPPSLLYSQERYITVNQVKYHIKEIGKGDKTVIFENGMSDSLEIWGAIPDSVARFARVLLYDRADIGKSGPSVNERTIPNMVLELRGILEDQNIKPPYILVGHSMGGLTSRYFAGNYPAEVIGLLLLDPAPESYWHSMSKKELKEYISGGTEWYNTKFSERYRKEWFRFIPNLEYMNNLNIDKHLPIIMVSATAWKWYRFHENIISGFDNAKHYELEGEHHIFKFHPDLTVSYIKELLNN